MPLGGTDDAAFTWKSSRIVEIMIYVLLSIKTRRQTNQTFYLLVRFLSELMGSSTLRGDELDEQGRTRHLAWGVLSQWPMPDVGQLLKMTLNFSTVL